MMLRAWVVSAQVATKCGRRYSSRLATLIRENAAQIAVLPEEVETKRFETFLQTSAPNNKYDSNSYTLRAAGLTKDQIMLMVTSAMSAMCVHHQSRICSLLGEGFYTIGPGGEEGMGAAALALRPNDAMALHYRHVAMQMLRQLQNDTPLDEMLLNRARAHVVSTLDPVTGGHHCAIGGGPYDFVVTSTLASQAPPAVGRGIGIGLSHVMGLSGKEGESPTFAKDAVSYVTVGDGSVNNAHFLSAVNAAEYWSSRHVRCPVIFGISDNNLCISLRGHNWLEKFQKKFLMRVFTSDSPDSAEQYLATKQAVDYARKSGRPAAVIYGGVVRRFGHAATDRQNKYMTKEEIAERAATNPIVPMCQRIVEEGYSTFEELHDLFLTVNRLTKEGFERAVEEPKIKTREEITIYNSAPTVPYVPPSTAPPPPAKKSDDAPQVMRMSMTRVYAELLHCYKNAVYVGEDVEHGGYYLVTETLKDSFNRRVFDWPPDETTLVGAGMGFSQCGLVPIVEIPYAKYLDCGADMFFEAAITHWLSRGKSNNGMIVRLQGFDRGVFGGNFHTHNTLHIPTGVDVVCYSNGSDYVRGIRYAFQQARAGRIVMTVDSTNLLNLRHVVGQDNAWLRPYPGDTADVMDWDQVSVDNPKGKIGIVTYGNGVVAAFQARELVRKKNSELADNMAIIDSPLLSATSKGLAAAVSTLDAVVFADVCKEREMPLLAHLHTLHSSSLLPQRWKSVGACRTYNPLGSTVTFLSPEDICDAVMSV